MSNFAFEPTLEQLHSSNIFRFMERHRISSLNQLAKRALEDPSWFWKVVSEDVGIVWERPYEAVLDSSRGVAWSRWFVGGSTNIYTSSVARFAELAPGRIAYHFVSEAGGASSITYSELNMKVCRLANGMRFLGIGKGDVIGIFLPMIEEALLAMLAAAVIGAVPMVVFSGYGSTSLRARLQDSKTRLLFVSDGFDRHGQPVHQAPVVEEAIRGTDIRLVVVSYRSYDKYRTPGAVCYEDLIRGHDSACEIVAMDSEDPLFILHTSGTTGRPKGTVQSHGGFSVFAGYQARYLTDMKGGDVLFWPADMGWITGLVWNLYGLLLTGSAAVIYDGALDHPKPGRLWNLLQRYGVTLFGISPTAVRTLRRQRAEPPAGDALGSIRLIFTTGEPIDEASWWWLFERVGRQRIPIVNLSGGTEVGGAMLSVLPGMRVKPCTVGAPCPGMNLDVVDDEGRPVACQKGYLVVRSPWPAMTRGLLNDERGYLEEYWSRIDGVWFHGDYVLKDDDGLWYMKGRVDDVINVSGHRLGTAEIEQGATEGGAAEAAAVSIPDAVTGEAIIVFAAAGSGCSELNKAVSESIAQRVGKVARPKMVLPISELPKTRTGKIMRRLLRAKLLGHPTGDLSSLENPAVLDEVPRLH